MALSPLRSGLCLVWCFVIVVASQQKYGDSIKVSMQITMSIIESSTRTIQRKSQNCTMRRYPPPQAA